MFITVELLNKYILQERERCAKIAEEHSDDQYKNHYCEQFCGEEIAKEIRKEPPMPDRPKRVPFQPLSKSAK